MKIYIAARFLEKERVKKAYELLKQHGHEITVDWTVHVPIDCYYAEKEMSCAYADKDIRGAVESDVFILLTGPEASLGASTELGAAIMSYTIFKKPMIYVVGPFFNQNIFFYHSSVCFKYTLEEVITEIGHITVKQSEQITL